jgi:Fe-S cluster assembly protein SufD
MKDTELFVDRVAAVARADTGRDQPAWLASIRQAGLARFTELGLPTLKHEDWRFTNVAPLAQQPFQSATESARESLDPSVLARLPLSGLPGDRLVFVDGHFAPALSRVGPQPAGVRLGSLAAALREDTALVEPCLGRWSRAEANAFTALNEAMFQDGAFIHVPAGTTLAEPVQLIFLTTGHTPGVASQPRNLILTGRESRITILEVHAGLAEAPTFTNTVTELAVGEHATVEHLKLQDERAGAFHFAALYAHLGRSSNLVAHSFALGSRLARQNIRTVLDGEGIECVLNGLYLGASAQLLDHHMIVDHARPHCASHEYFNGILADRARGVFHGRILVRPGAQKTDAKQTNKNLLLSNQATADTKPQLEIYADDVKCTHGATVGQLNPESIFYLRSRGIPADTARRMLIHAFAGEIIERIRCVPAREELDRLVWQRLDRQQQVRVDGASA